MKLDRVSRGSKNRVWPYGMTGKKSKFDFAAKNEKKLKIKGPNSDKFGLTIKKPFISTDHLFFIPKTPQVGSKIPQKQCFGLWHDRAIGAK